MNCVIYRINMCFFYYDKNKIAIVFKSKNKNRNIIFSGCFSVIPLHHMRYYIAIFKSLEGLHIQYRFKIFQFKAFIN